MLAFNQMNFLLKLILPSWTLFDLPGDHCKLYFRQIGSDISGPWISVQRPTYDRKLRQLLFNPVDCSWLFFFSLIDEHCYKLTLHQNFSLKSNSAFSMIKIFLHQQVLGDQPREIPIQLKFSIYSENDELKTEFTSEVFEC